MGLMDGLSKLGVKNIDNGDLYEKPAAKQPVVPKEPEKKEKPKQPEIQEADFLLRKTYDCPVCESKFKDLTLKSNRARMIGTTKGLRPIYDHIEPLKYEAIVCPVCGYAVMNRYLIPLVPSQKKAVKESICVNFQGIATDKEVYTYEDAIERITLALASAVVKRAKASEKAYICLKGGWLCESYLDTLDPEDAKQEILYEEIAEKKKEFMENAYDGFVTAMQEENYPIGGMDEMTLNYLIAVMAMDRGKYEIASKMVAAILQSVSASSRLKDKARELKTELVAILRKNKQQ